MSPKERSSFRPPPLDPIAPGLRYDSGVGVWEGGTLSRLLPSPPSSFLSPALPTLPPISLYPIPIPHPFSPAFCLLPPIGTGRSPEGT